jgi:hypothetical protein
VISYEVFFSDRVREAVRAGGRLVIVSTNASSYAGDEVPATEPAAARLRAREFGRADRLPRSSCPTATCWPGRSSAPQRCSAKVSGSATG